MGVLKFFLVTDINDHRPFLIDNIVYELLHFDKLRLYPKGPFLLGKLGIEVGIGEQSPRLNEYDKQ